MAKHIRAPNDSAARIAAWREYGKALKKALWSNVCLVEKKYQCGWNDGGCYSAAWAVAGVTGGRIMGVESNVGVEHVVVQNPDGLGFLDADGFSTERQLFARWRKEIETGTTRKMRGIAPIEDDRATGAPTLDLNGDVVCDLTVVRDLLPYLPFPPSAS